MNRQITIFEVTDLDGNFVCSGDVWELSERFCVTRSTIWEDARKNHTLLSEYKVKKMGTMDMAPRPISTVNAEIAKCVRKGVPRKNIGERFHLSKSAVMGRITTLRRHGVIE